MSDDSLARTPSAAPSHVAADYDAIHETIAATERGRWFLDEHARRYRGADTERVLAAIERVEQALSGGRAAGPGDSAPDEFAAMLDAIAQTRRDIVGRYGDPAASGEAALADFRNAAEQIRELVLASYGRDSELGTQLSFLTNRLANAGERIERSVAGLRTLLGMLEGLDPRLHERTTGSGREAADAPPRSAAALQIDSPIHWTLPTAEAAEGALPERGSGYLDQAVPIRIESEQRSAPPDSGNAAAFWDTTLPQPEADRDQAAASNDSSGAYSEASITDWAFAPAGEVEPAAAGDGSPDEPPKQEPISALEHLEAREYGRYRVATAGATQPLGAEQDSSALASETPDPSPPQEGWDDLVLGLSALDEDGGDRATREPAVMSWTADPAAAAEAPAADLPDEQSAAGPASEPLFDSDLFESEGREHGATANPELPAAVMDAGIDTTDANPAEPEKWSPEGLRTREFGLLAEHVPDARQPHSAAFLEQMTADPDPDMPQAVGPEHHPADDQQYAWETRLPPLPAWPDPVPETTASTPQASGTEGGADVPTVLQRLETVRTAIAALMDEVTEKTARRNPPRS